MGTNKMKIIDLEEGWNFIYEKGIAKLRENLEGVQPEKQLDSKEYRDDLYTIVYTCGIPDLRKNVEGVQEKQFNAEEYMDLYTVVYNMCSQEPNYSQQLYDRYRQSFDEYLTTVVLPLVRGKHGECMLRELVSSWKNHKIMIRYMSRFLQYLHQRFISSNLLPGLVEVGLLSFRDLVYGNIKYQVKDVVISLIEQEGEQIDRLLKNVLDMVVEIDVGNVDVYKAHIEAHMLQDTVACYYSCKAASWLQTDQCAQYILKVENCLRREEERAGFYIQASNQKKYMKKVEHELLLQYQTQLLEWCPALLTDDKVDDLSRMYRLFSRIPKGFSTISGVFFKHVADAGATLVQEQQAKDADAASAYLVHQDVDQVEDAVLDKQTCKGAHIAASAYLVQQDDNQAEDAILVTKQAKGAPSNAGKVYLVEKDAVSANLVDARAALVKKTKVAEKTKTIMRETVQQHALVVRTMELVSQLHDRYSHYVGKCFANHPLFQRAWREALELFCNKLNVARCTTEELLATFYDSLMTNGGIEKLSDGAVEETIQKVIKLLLYSNIDMDHFAELCRKKLARRLLTNVTANVSHDRRFLRKLRQQWGEQYTSKMKGMITDLTVLAEENHSLFEDYVAHNVTTSNRTSKIDFSVKVLTSWFWPKYISSDLALPPEMLECVQVFNEFHETTKKRRKLRWIYSLGSCIISATFDAKPIELIVSTYQAVILLLFNVSDRLSYSEIKRQVNLANGETLRLLHSLSRANYKILKKTPGTEPVGETDWFEFNANFTHEMSRVKIPLPPLDEKKTAIQDVYKDRRYAIDAAIMRVMKSRKVLSHPQLVQQCMEKFVGMLSKPDLDMVIKQRVDNLIGREYLEQDQNDPNILKYIA